jgi:hypothetical protein
MNSIFSVRGRNSARRFGLAVIVATLSAVCVTSADAATYTYNYVGNDFTSAPLGGIGPYSNADFVTLSLTFSAPLGNNLALSDVGTPLSFTASDGFDTITNVSYTPSLTYFNFGTSPTGQITDWVIRVGIDVPFVGFIVIGSSSDSVFTADGLQSALIDNDAIENLNSPGNWSSQVSTTPLPSTWLMLLSGFVGLGFFAHRGTKKRAAFSVA